MKFIKFDLPLNGVKVHNLEELRDNFTTEIMELHSSGILLKWLNNRKLIAEADKLSAIPAGHDDVDKLVALCEVFGVETDRKVIEVALAKSQTSQGVMLHEDPDELKYKEKFENLSKLLDALISKKLYITQEDYNLFVKNKIQIEQEEEVVIVRCCEEIIRLQYLFRGRHFRTNLDNERNNVLTFKWKNKIGDIIEVGDTLGEIIADPDYSSAKINGGYSSITSGSIVSPVRGVLIEKGSVTLKPSKYRKGDTICLVRVGHDITPTVKIISG